MPRITDYEQLLTSMYQLDEMEHALWMNPKWGNKSVESSKKSLFLEFLGHQLSDEKFEKMKKNIEENQELKELFDDLVDRGRGEFLGKQKVYDAFRRAFVSPDADRRKDYIAAAKSMLNDYNDILKYNHGTGRDNNGSPVPGDEPGLETFAYNKEKLRRNVYKKNLDSIKAKVYNENDIDMFSIDWGAPDVTLGEYKAAAAILVDHEIEIWNCNYSYQKCVDEKKAIEKDIKKLTDNRDFRGYVNEVLAKGDEKLFEKDAFLSGWEAYQLEISQIRENQKVEVMFGDKKAESIEYDNSTTNKEQVKDKVNAIIDASIRKNKVFTQRDEIEACDFIIAKVFAGPTYDKTYLNSELGANTEEGAFIFNSVLDYQVNDMREAILKDPVFLNTLSERVDRKSFFDVYKNNVKKEINKKITAEKKEDKKYLENADKKALHEKFMKETKVDISKKKRDFYEEVRDALTDINKSKKPSKYMKRLMNALKNVVGKDSVNAEAINELNKAALSYYKERQGIFFSPFTDNGKARLDYVENLIRLTDKEMKDIRKEEVKYIKSGGKVEVKQEAPKADAPKAENSNNTVTTGKRKIVGLGPKVMIKK